jgi:hypothetical protein
MEIHFQWALLCMDDDSLHTEDTMARDQDEGSFANVTAYYCPAKYSE